ncbi:unnamed protein product [Alopecurus aequalis]
MPRRNVNASGAGSSRRRRRRDDDDDESVPSDNTSDSDFVADTEDEAGDDDDDFASDEDVAAAPAVVPVVVAPRPVLPPRPREAKGRKKKKHKGKDKPSLPWKEWEDANAKWLDVRDEAEEKADASATTLLPTAEPAPEVLLQLLRFQKEWLAWALAQEASVSRGGILADEMGMGKTIQGIALVLTARGLRSPASASRSRPSPSTGLPMRRVGCTLVICPVVAVIQWVQEIERHTAKGSVRVLQFTGPKRSVRKHDFNNYDFVVTTYSTIEADYRKHIMPPKIRCQYCDKQFYPDKMKVHLRYFCGPDALRTEKQAKQKSKRWSDKKDKGKGNRAGNKRKSDAEEEEDFEESEELGSEPRGKSPLHSVRWERIILDEAHFIKDRRCNTARAVFELESEYKWALSGTPLQNRVGELYSLIRFLQIFPYSNYFCKDCDCEILDTQMKKKCDCGHSSVRHFCWWNKYIATPILHGSASFEGRRAMTLLKEKVLKGIVLRRTKIGRAADLALPPKIVTLRRDSFDKNEMEFYEALYTQSCTQFDSYVVAGTLLNNYAHIFDLLTRLRQAVDHPYLVAFSKTAVLREESRKGNDAMESQCGICDDLPKDVVREEIRNMVEHDGSAKGIVFSQFTSFLDLIEFSLHKSGIKCVQLNGKMNMAEKGRAIDTFINDPDCRIFLMSLKAGGVALNLTVASHVFLMDPWWNPAVESQAQDRIHRIGQFKPIRSMRFVIKDTVEERILQLQEKKQLVFDGTVGDSPEAMSKLTEADLKFLFQN